MDSCDNVETPVTYRYNLLKCYTRRDGTRVAHHDSSVHRYTPKLHHPNAEEMAAIRDELAKGVSKKDVIAAHRLGTYPRLARLLQKWPAGTAAETSSEAAPETVAE